MAAIHTGELTVLNLALQLARRLRFRKWFWQIRSAYRLVVFRVGNLKFRANQAADSSIFSIRVFTRLLSVVAGSALFAVVAFLALLVTRKYWLVISDASGASYDSALLAIASVIGIFLSLYFTGINTVIGTIYAKAPAQVRNLIVNERVNNVSVGFLVNLTLLCLMLLAAGLVANYRPLVALITVIALACFSVLVFAQLSRRAFQFFDPTLLADHLVGEITRWSVQATPSGLLWLDPSFQDHYRKRAISALQALSALADISHEEDNLQGEPRTRLMAKVAGLCSTYIERRLLVPTKSRWYGQLPSHKDWFLSPESEVRIATYTGTSLAPNMKADAAWLERELIDIELEALRNCLSDGHDDSGVQILNYLSGILAALGHTWSIDAGKSVITTASSILLEARDFADLDSSEKLMHEAAREKLALIDTISLLPIALLLGFLDGVKRVKLDLVAEQLTTLDWDTGAAIFKLGLPLPALERLEYLQEAVAFEVKVEGRTISPAWYLIQLVCQPLARSFASQVQLLSQLGKQAYLETSRSLVASKKNVAAAMVISRGLEYVSKFVHQRDEFRGLSEALEAKRTVQDIPWISWDWKSIDDEFDLLQDELMICWGDCISGLAKLETTDDLPDFFGQAVHMAGEQCFQSLLNNKPETFAKLFPKYFVGILGIYERLGPKTSTLPAESAVAVSSDPLLDLVSLSGYSKLLAEFHQNERLWDTCRNTWTAYLGRVDTNGVLKHFAALIRFHRGLPMLTPRSTVRTAWKMRFEAMLHSLQRKQRIQPREYRRRSISDDSIVDHPSLLIRVVAGTQDHYFTFYEGVDVFAELFLKQLRDSDDIDFGTRDGLLDAMERWREYVEQDSESLGDDLDNELSNDD